MMNNKFNNEFVFNLSLVNKMPKSNNESNNDYINRQKEFILFLFQRFIYENYDIKIFI